MTDEFKVDVENFWVQTADRVRAYMFCACGSLADTDDLVQECYLRALRGWSQFNGSGSRQAWLFGIARRTCADWFRHKSKNDTVARLDNADEISCRLKSTNTEQVEVVWETIKQLDAEQKEVIHLRFAAGLSYIEIAEALKIPIGTVRSRLHRGLRVIREKMEA